MNYKIYYYYKKSCKSKMYQYSIWKKLQKHKTREKVFAEDIIMKPTIIQIY